MKRKLLWIGIIIAIILWYKKMFVLALIVGGFFVAPEASKVLSHYCFGDGETLYLDSSYIQKSPVVRKAVAKLKVGENIERVAFLQKKDWRLSYAINGFSISRTAKGYVINQWIEFDTSGKVPTNLNFGILKIGIKDAVVHAFNCTPFMVICEFSTLKNE